MTAANAIRRPLLILAALILAATAVFHLSGLPMIEDWFEGQRRSVLIVLWIAPAAAWLLISFHWLREAVLRSAPPWSVLLLTVLIPLTTAVPLIALVPQHPGGYLLASASVLALSSRKAAR